MNIHRAMLLGAGAAALLLASVSYPVRAAEEIQTQTETQTQAQTQAQNQTETQIRKRDRIHTPGSGKVVASGNEIYGSQLMTQQERMEYRQRMQSAKTAEEREQIRAEHHKEMQARAKKMGAKLPDTPPAVGARKGMSVGPGATSNSGKGVGKGVGKGTGRRLSPAGKGAGQGKGR